MCQEQTNARNVENARITRVSDVAAWFRTDCDEEQVAANRHVSKCRLYLGRAMLNFLSVIKQLRASSRVERVVPVRPPMIQFVSLESD
jgi:hypothetical protein